ncbi:hypothetical protein [Alteromonas sp. AMM-1]|uniref:hypothetical protein n=1 Tax=Alteromonas sp. AMM-1 TaxID=3394233 RepID=UPI0039A77235
MKELQSLEVLPASGRLHNFRVELHGGDADFVNVLSDGSPETVRTFDGTESALERRFKHEITEGDDYYFILRNGAKAFYR